MGKQWKQCETLFWGAPKSPQIVTAWNKRHLLLGRKAMTNLDGILKSRDITLPTKVYLVKAMVFPVVMYVCESWTIKKAEHRRTDAFELWCWRRLLRVPWTARRSNQSILKENEVAQSCPTLCDPVDCSPAGSSVHGILQAKILELVAISFSSPKGNQSWIFIGRTDAEAETPVFWPPDVKKWLIGKDPDAGKDWRREEKGTTEDEMVGWHHRLEGHEF